MIKITILNSVTLSGEVWRQIPNYPNYLISNMGRLYSGFDNQIRKGSYKKGYHIYELFNEQNKGKRHGKRIRAARLVAAAFCKNYAKDKHIHHINRNRTDDRAINLLPVTAAEHRAIHVLYDILAKNIPLLAELLQPIIHCNVNLLFDDTKGGDVA
ncbi:MAG: HNH endonuclease [Treponema sp.]|nr:HNH endonuclease [Treponema sp.]